MDEEEPCAKGIDEVVETVGVGDAVNRGIEGEGECENVGEELDAVETSVHRKGTMSSRMTYRLVTRGTILPVLCASTSRMKGRMQRRLWWVEKEVSHCTERLCIQTTRTGRLRGRIQSMSIKVA